jgi:hypothetical protein
VRSFAPVRSPDASVTSTSPSEIEKLAVPVTKPASEMRVSVPVRSKLAPSSVRGAPNRTTSSSPVSPKTPSPSRSTAL